MTNIYFTPPPPPHTHTHTHSFQRGGKTLFVSRVLAILALILGTCSSFAQKYEIIDEYRYQLRNDEAILTSNSTWKYTGDIVVPSKVKASDGKSYKVTEIEGGCFRDCKTVTSVTLPSTISKIGQYCFADCEQMKSVNIPSAVKTISQYTFSGCTNLESLVIPASVENLGQGSFYHCYNIKTVRFLGKVPKINESDLVKTASLYVPKDYLQDYKKAIGNNYPKIYAWTGDAEHPLCEVPSIAYSDGNLLFACNTPGAQVHYSVSSADIVTDALADDGQVSLVAAYDISAYATAEHYEKSDSEYATIYWLPTNDGSSTGIKQTETRGIMVSSHGNVISVNGLDEGETISLYTIDGKLIGNAKASGGMASCTVTEPIVVVKIGELSIKITIR